MYNFIYILITGKSTLNAFLTQYLYLLFNNLLKFFIINSKFINYDIIICNL